MCYMSSVGVRELRQEASRLLERVAAGESIEITNHGRPVARLVPIDYAYPRTLEVLVAEGVARLGSGEPWLVEPGVPGADAPSGAEILEEQRADRL